MKILAVDTSDKSASIALIDGERTVAEASSVAPGAHAVWLMPNIEAMLKGADTALRDIDFFAVTKGPGSFTGLRIGISAVKGMAWAFGKKVFAVSSLEALSLNLRSSQMPVCAMLDARKGEVYAALYDFAGGKAAMLMDEAAFTPDELIKTVASKLGAGCTAAFVGSGLATYGTVVKDGLKGAVIAPEELWRINAVNAGLLAKELLVSGKEPVDAVAVVPVYLRRPEAEYKAKPVAPAK